jgi:hypothetical protein
MKTVCGCNGRTEVIETHDPKIILGRKYTSQTVCCTNCSHIWMQISKGEQS